jgi:hypothetical protein
VVGIRSSEDIIRDIRPDISVRVVPLDIRRHALDLSHVKSPRELLAHVGIALDVVLAALPRPARRPADAGARRALHGGTLVAGAGGAFAPVVVVELVPVGRVVRVLRAEGCGLAAHGGHALGDGGSDGAGGGEGQEAAR